MLKEGTLPSGYGVYKRDLVRLGPDGKPLSKKAAKKSGFKAGKKIKKAELVAVMRKQKKSGKKKAA
jgi:hypothetical protein